MASNEKKNLSHYLMPVAMTLLGAAITFVAGFMFNLHGEFQVTQEVDRNQSAQIVKIIEQLDKNTEDRYKGSDAAKDRQVVDEKFNSIKLQISDMKEMLRKIERKIDK